jgi:hypothetical protein
MAKSNKKKKAQKRAQRNPEENDTTPSINNRTQRSRRRALANLDDLEAENMNRDHTRRDDFAPGEIGSDYESHDESDNEFKNLSDDDAPTTYLRRHKPAPAGTWVADIIRKATSDKGDKVMDDFFGNPNPNYNEVEKFFTDINDRIRAANVENGVDAATGEIPYQMYKSMHDGWKLEVEKAAIDSTTFTSEDGWKAYDKVYTALKAFNRQYQLPEGWNISASVPERIFGSRPVSMEEAAQSVEDSASTTSANEDDDSSSVEDMKSGLDALEARAREDQRLLSRAKVLYWWSKGVGTQIFVRYGTRDTPIYRIRAGSHEFYDPSKVTRVLTKARGNAKIQVRRDDGVPDEIWEYSRENVSDILGVGWKVEDDDESEINPLDLIRPEPNALYPQTRILVKWKDGTVTLEGRAFIRRITKGSSLDGDRVIYQKAEELEQAYLQAQHEFSDYELEDELDDEIPGEVKDSEVTARRPQGQSVRSAPRSTRSSGTNNVRFADSRSEDLRVPSTKTVPRSTHSSSRSKRGTGPGSSGSVRSQGREVAHDPRDAEIKWLREQLDRLTTNNTGPKQGYSHGPQGFRRPYGYRVATDRYDEGFEDEPISEMSSQAPNPRWRRGRRSRGRWQNYG